MKEISLRLGPLKAEGYSILRSGARWLCESGQMCAAGQPIAYFNLNVDRGPGKKEELPAFADERTIQVVCTTRVAGRLKYDASNAPGGYLSILSINRWDADSVLAHLEVEEAAAESSPDPGRLRLLMLAGRRMTHLVDVHVGLLPGWNNRSRAWWGEEGETPSTLLSLGICDVTGVVIGERGAFLEMFAAEKASSQFVFVPDHPVAPAASVLLDQLVRTPAQFQAIAADLTSKLGRFSATPSPDDLMFAGTLLSSLEHNPIRETYDLLSADGLCRGRPAEVLLLSLASEPPSILRHKQLGYRMHILRHHQLAAGPAIRGWLDSAFETTRRTVSDMKADYEVLIDAVKKTTGAHIMILNTMSTSGEEDISSYAPFDAPLSGALASIASKEANLMLHDLAANRSVSIIDVDAIAADIGGSENIPDGIHQSKLLQDLLRQEILRVMRAVRSA